MLDHEQNMRAIVASQPGGPEVLEVQMRAIPTPGDREVLIKVAAAGVNGADLRERQGKYPVPAGAPDLMGLEVSGEIVEVGLNCNRFKIGEWERFYNFHRPHGAHNGKTPYEALREKL